MRSIFERGREELAAQADDYARRREYNLVEGRRQLRRAWVFRFYHDTMINTDDVNAAHGFGPESPDPVINPSGEVGAFGGGYHNVDWFWEYEGIRWKGEWTWRGVWDLTFYVRPKRKNWVKVYTPGQVVEALD